jgi:hypothetical protein
MIFLIQTSVLIVVQAVYFITFHYPNIIKSVLDIIRAWVRLLLRGQESFVPGARMQYLLS